MHIKKILWLILIWFALADGYAFAFWPFSADTVQERGNRHSQSFYAVKKEMLDHIYYDHRQTLYCHADFTAHKKIVKPKGFKLPDLKNVDFYVYDISSEELQRKAERMEWEHIVPAQNFGKTFTEWSQGHPNCRAGKGKKYKGRKCAEQESEEFRYMYTDMYNLYPSIGAVNYLRANFNFAQLPPNAENTFGTCRFKLTKNRAEPRDEIKGLIARTYLYMQQTYPRYKIGEPMYGLMKAWAKKYPVTPWECTRAYRIEHLQGNPNDYVKAFCLQEGLYHN